jgi:hypothetical protein
MKKLPLAIAVALLAATPAAASAADITSTVTGPTGTVWTGTCPGTVAESDIGTVSPMCRALGYSMDTSTYRTIVALGGTTLTDTRADGSVLNLERITPEGRWVRTNYLDDGGYVVTDCAISGNAVPYSGCTRTEHLVGGGAKAAAARRAHAKHRRR